MSTPNDSTNGTSKPVIGCSIKVLPRSEWEHAAATAIARNPANAPMTQMLQIAGGDVIKPSHLALMTSKYWGNAGVRLTVSFMDGAEAALRARILSHMNAWARYANVEFVQVPSGGQVRIARKVNDGYWSYLGTDVLRIPSDEPTMNLDSFTMDTPESEFVRVVRHETGHTLGFPHEHMTSGIISRIDREKAIRYFMATQGWTREGVIDQVLTPLENSALIATQVADPTSVMCYFLPAAIMKDGIAVPGGPDINATDGQFAGSVYPKFAAWQLIDNNAQTASIAVDGADIYQLHKSGLIWKFTGTPITGWQILDNNSATRKIVAANGRLYQLHNGGRIWRYTGPPVTGWQLIDENPATVEIVASGNDLYQVHNNGRIWIYTGTPIRGWKELDNNPETKKIASSGGGLYQLHKSGLIWRYTGTPMTGWQKIDENPATVDIVARGNDLYQLHNSGRIWKYTGVPVTGWQLLDDNTETKEIVVGVGGLYQIHKSGSIWSYVGPPMTGWKQLDGNAASMSIAAGTSLYQLHSSGLIWRYMG
ncbi:peptidase m12 [Fusarium austroafricanum]|uniref:Peptidase m12 n=1 Tax=Fusarium austroafricanum TaxID=2364996 RepID=A0A8H4P5B7_9HYPO|nr:peptidase m12 [Fusarium austroafricanum]